MFISRDTHHATHHMTLSSTSGPLVALHPYDVIPGTQQWYKFPSQLLVSYRVLTRMVGRFSRTAHIYCYRKIEGVQRHADAIAKMFIY